MKMQISTAITLRDELIDKLNRTDSQAHVEIELSPVASALIADAIEREQLQAKIDEKA